MREEFDIHDDVGTEQSKAFVDELARVPLLTFAEKTEDLLEMIDAEASMDFPEEAKRAMEGGGKCGDEPSLLYIRRRLSRP